MKKEWVTYPIVRKYLRCCIFESKIHTLHVLIVGGIHAPTGYHVKFRNSLPVPSQIKIKCIDRLLADTLLANTCPQAANHCALLKLYSCCHVCVYLYVCFSVSERQSAIQVSNTLPQQLLHTYLYKFKNNIFDI